MLFYSLMLLETDIHSHKILVKRTECDWVRNNRELVRGGEGQRNPFLFDFVTRVLIRFFSRLAGRRARSLTRFSDCALSIGAQIPVRKYACVNLLAFLSLVE